MGCLKFLLYFVFEIGNNYIFILHFVFPMDYGNHFACTRIIPDYPTPLFFFPFQDIYLAKRLYDSAADANPDARVPVALALIKIYFLFGMKYLQEVVFLSFFLILTGYFTTTYIQEHKLRQKKLN